MLLPNARCSNRMYVDDFSHHFAYPNWDAGNNTAIAQGMGFSKGEEVLWTIADKADFILFRKQVPPNPIDLKNSTLLQRVRSPHRCLLRYLRLPYAALAITLVILLSFFCCCQGWPG